MRVVVAPDGIGSTLAAAEAARAIARGWLSARPSDDVVVKPQSDGGPGFIECLDGVGQVRTAAVDGPLPSAAPVTARWRFDDGTAYLETAQACGLHLVADPSPRTALDASTAGVGQLIAAVLADGDVTRLVVGLGGSSTTDGGEGMLAVLGGPAAAAEMLRGVRIVVATDVDNPLVGPRGAAEVFAPQKGADRPTVDVLATRLTDVATRLDAFAGLPVSSQPGAGAAGGLGAALIALGGLRESGADLVAEATGLSVATRGAAVVITGEGRLDAQTAAGKVVARVAAAADPGSTVIALVGECALVTPGAVDDLGIDRVHSLVDHAGDRARALTQAEPLLVSLAARVAERYSAEEHETRE
ncbi:hypothetical protein HLA97_11560 [Gordonia araii NBRC 100433]|nr:hypothetical protein [Gordonia araii NBRC 100433]